MKKAFGKAALILIGFAPLSADIGDFAPLRVGDTWKYKGFSSQNPCCTFQDARDSILRVITVQSQNLRGDTTVFRVLIHDSLFSRYFHPGLGGVGTYPPDFVSNQTDSVRETGSTILPSPFASIFFPRHLIPADSMAGVTSISAQSKWVYARSDTVLYFESGVIKTKILIQDVGLAEYRYVYAWNNYRTVQSFRLLEFNGVPLGNWVIVGVLGKPMGRRRALWISPLHGTILATNRDALGRMVPLPIPGR